MPEPITCDVRNVAAPDGTQIPVPLGGLGLPDGTAADIRADADVQISIKSDQDGNTVGYYILVNNAPQSDGEAVRLFGELAQEGAIATLENLATRALGLGASVAIRFVGAAAGVLATLLTPSALTREVFIRCELDDGSNTDKPPLTYCLLLPA